MDELVITAAGRAKEADLKTARLGTRFGRLDLGSQLALLAVEGLAGCFESWPRRRIGICLAATAGSLSTDVKFWNERDATGGPSPTLFAYTLPSAALGEIAIRHRLTGPGLCFIGGSQNVLTEAADWLARGEADGCVCVFCNAISLAAAQMVEQAPAACAHAFFMQRGGLGPPVSGQIDRDIEALYARFHP